MKINWKDWSENPDKPITRREFCDVFKEKLGVDVEEDENGLFVVLASGERKSAVEFLRDAEIKLA